MSKSHRGAGKVPDQPVCGVTPCSLVGELGRLAPALSADVGVSLYPSAARAPPRSAAAARRRARTRAGSGEACTPRLPPQWHAAVAHRSGSPCSSNSSSTAPAARAPSPRSKVSRRSTVRKATPRRAVEVPMSMGYGCCREGDVGGLKSTSSKPPSDIRCSFTRAARRGSGDALGVGCGCRKPSASAHEQASD
jgi:hypothetical protein